MAAAGKPCDHVRQALGNSTGDWECRECGERGSGVIVYSISVDGSRTFGKPDSPKPHQPETNNRHGRRKLAAQLRRRRP